MHRAHGILAILVLIISLSVTGLGMAGDGTTVRRAAFDIGSSNIKCTVADVDLVSGDIVKVIETYTAKVGFADDMARSYDGNLSREVLDAGMTALRELKFKALKVGAQEFAGVGGGIFSKARNGRAYFATISKDVGISCRITSRRQAALLSYYAVRQEKSIAVQNLLVWDIGGSSQCMAARSGDGSLVFYIDQMASVSFKNAVIEIIQGRDVASGMSPNPVSQTDAHRAIEYVQTYAQMNVTPELVARIKRGDMTIIGIGGVHYYAIPEMLGGREAIYTRHRLQDGIVKWVGKSDEDFDSKYAPTRFTDMLLVLGYMKALGIEEVAPLKVNLSQGLLVSPEYW